MNSVMRITAEDSVLLIVDVQEKLFKVILNREQVLKNIVKLVKLARLLNIPILVTEQNPQGLGKTIPELIQVLEDSYRPIEKTSFSCFECSEFRKELERLNRKTLLITGIEAHICIYQTAIDALDYGYRPVVIYDATGSRLEPDYKIVLHRLISKGVDVATTDMIIFELVKDAASPVFKDVLKIVKES